MDVALDAHTSGTGGGYKAEYPRIGIEAFGDVLPILNLGSTVESQVEPAMIIEERLQYIEDFCHLSEYKNPMSASFPFT